MIKKNSNKINDLDDDINIINIENKSFEEIQKDEEFEEFQKMKEFKKKMNIDCRLGDEVDMINRFRLLNHHKRKSYCDHVCEAIPLVFKNFKLKICDHLILGGEHVRKVSPGYHSPIKPNLDMYAPGINS